MNKGVSVPMGFSGSGEGWDGVAVPFMELEGSGVEGVSELDGFVRAKRFQLTALARMEAVASLGEGLAQDTRVASPRPPGGTWGLHAMGMASHRKDDTSHTW